MIYLLLAIISSALVSVIMRLSTNRVRNNIGMLSMNYLTCLVIAAAFSGITTLFPKSTQLPQALGLGAINGALYLFSFILFQRSVKKNGVVLSSIFMKLGLLVPLVLSILMFGEAPTVLQIIGFCIAIGAIILINLKTDASDTRMGPLLIFLLLMGGSADAMSKIYEETGPVSLSSQFLFYTFLVAFVLCIILMLIKKQRIGRNEILYGCLIGIPNFFSAKFLLLSLDTVPAVVAYPTFSVGTILVVTLVGVAVFKERLTIKQIIAACAILTALVMLNV
ncbi:MAG: DMT family transporter [Ruminococcus sp.]|nr:DMT family transporter [Ruminococcus sp.]